MPRKRKDMTAAEREARSHKSHNKFKTELGNRCANCGSDSMIEYHHIVPLSLGGTNSITNVVPLCYFCHKAAHMGRHIHSFADHSRSNDGRPPNCDDDTAFQAYDLMLAGEIGNRKCKVLMGLSKSTHPKDVQQFRKWCSSRGVKLLRSTLDVAIANGSAREGALIGCVVYADGSEANIYFHDTGMNDDTEYCLRGTTGTATWGEIKAAGAIERAG